MFSCRRPENKHAAHENGDNDVVTESNQVLLPLKKAGRDPLCLVFLWFFRERGTDSRHVSEKERAG